MILLAIDPGLRGCGAVLFEDGVLRAAAYVRGEGVPEVLLMLARATALGVERWVVERIDERLPSLFGVREAVDRLVLELPQTYGGRASRGDANDLIALAAVDGAIAALFPLASVQAVRPHEWKGSVPKPKSARGKYIVQERVWERLSAEERGRVVWPKAEKLKWDVADAIGIGLWALGRFERKRGVVA